MSGAIYFLSEVAREGLISQATRKGYIRPATSIRHQGLSNYIAWITERSSLIDDRPTDVRASDDQRISVGYFPYWSTEEMRMPIRLVLSPPVKARLISIANLFLITNTRRGLSSLRRDMPSSRISAVLEAIGISWLLVREK